MEERGVCVDHSSVNRWAVQFLPLLEHTFRKHKRREWQPAHGRDVYQGQRHLEIPLPCGGQGRQYGRLFVDG